MPFIKAKNGNVVELAEDLVEEFLAQGHAGPFDTEAEARKADASAPAPGKAPDGDVPAEPKGNGSTEEWKAYADHLGVEYPPEAKRDDVKALVAEALAELDDDESDDE